jgi:hypothetical protein
VATVRPGAIAPSGRCGENLCAAIAQTARPLIRRKNCKKIGHQMQTSREEEHAAVLMVKDSWRAEG